MLRSENRKIEDLVSEHAPRLRAEWRLNPETDTGKMFHLSGEEISPQMKEHFGAFVDIAIPQLVRGHFRHRRPFQSLNSRGQQLQNQEGRTTLYPEALGHDLYHSIIALAEAEPEKRGNPTSLTPLFQKVGPLGISLADYSLLPKKLRHALHRDETLVSLIEGSAGHMVIQQNTPNVEMLMRRNMIDTADTTARRVFESFMKHDTEDPRFYWNFFEDVSRPLIENAKNS